MLDVGAGGALLHQSEVSVLFSLSKIKKFKKNPACDLTPPKKISLASNPKKTPKKKRNALTVLNYLKYGRKAGAHSY